MYLLDHGRLAMKKIIVGLVLFASFFVRADEVYLYDYNGSPEVCQSTNAQDIMDCFYRDFGKDGYEFRPTGDGSYQLYSFSRGEWLPDGMWFFINRYKHSCSAGNKSFVEQLTFRGSDANKQPDLLCYQNCEQKAAYQNNYSSICIGSNCSAFNVDLESTGKVCVSIDGGYEIAENLPQDVPDDQRYKPCPANVGSYLKDVSECEAFPPKETPQEPPTETPKEPPTETPQEPPTETPPETPDDEDKQNGGGGGKLPDNGNNAGTQQGDGNPDGSGSGSHHTGQDGDGKPGGQDGEGEGEEDGSSISGGSCRSGTPPKCEGDAVQCYIAEQSFYQRCATQGIETISGQINEVDLGDGITFGSKQPRKEDFIGNFTQEIDLGSYISDIDDSGFFSASQCMANTSFTVKGKKIEISWEYWCLFLQYIGYFIVALAYYRGLFIIAKGFE